MRAMLSRARDAVNDGQRFRDTSQGQRQSHVLRALEEASGRRRSEVVADLDQEIRIGHDQYRRYLRGDTPLRWDQIAAFATAYRITKAELSRALGLMDDEDLIALRARVLEALGPENAAVADDVARGLLGHTDDVRDAALASMQDVLGRLPKDDRD